MKKDNQSVDKEKNSYGDPSYKETPTKDQPLFLVSQKTIEAVKGLHQYYRDCLSQSFEFPDIGELPMEIIRWVTNSSNTNITQLAEYMQQYLPGKNLSAEHDLALRLMLFTIMQANLASDVNNRFTDYALPSDYVDNIRRGIGRILSLNDHDAYFANAVRVLYRVNMIEDVLSLLEAHPEIVDKYPDLQAIAGFIHMNLGDYARSLQYLYPLILNQTNRNLPLVALSFMTCRYFLGQPTESPLTFSSLSSDTSDLPGLIEKLSPIEIIQPLPDSISIPIVFVACNDAYFFQHALYLAYSIHERNPKKLALHLHLYSPNKSVLAEIESLKERLPNLAIGVSVEYGAIPISHPATYYATARFVRAYELLRYYQRDLCIMDADALFNNSWDNFMAHLTPQTELVLACPKAAPFWEQVIAGFVYCKATPKAEYFLAKVAQFILRNIEEKKAIWFLDQIALSVCNDSFTNNDQAVKHIDMALLIDTQHKPQALTWTVTAHKNNHPRYNFVREEFSKKYNQLPQSSIDYILTHISQMKSSIFFIQIGAMDGVSFDPINFYVKKFGWKGILVEPLPDMMEKTQRNYADYSGLVFENVAITEHEESRSLFRIPIDAAKDAGLPDWVLGMSTFVPGKLDQFHPHVIAEPVSCMPLSRLIEKHQPEKIDVLQIDTEGYDLKILKQFDFLRYQPFVVNLEVVNLNPEEKREAMELLSNNNYIYYHNDMDLFAVRRDILFPA